MSSEPTALRIAEAAPVEPLMMRVKDAAEVVGMSERKFRDVLAEGHIESVRHGHSRLVIADSLRAWVDRLRADPDAGTGL